MNIKTLEKCKRNLLNSSPISPEMNISLNALLGKTEDIFNGAKGGKRFSFYVQNCDLVKQMPRNAIIG